MDDRRLTMNECHALTKILNRDGEAKVVERVKLSSATVSRALAGQEVRRSTVVLLRQEIAGGVS